MPKQPTTQHPSRRTATPRLPALPLQAIPYALYAEEGVSLSNAAGEMRAFLYDAWRCEVARAICDAVLDDVAAGRIPAPEVAPEQFERVLAARAVEASAAAPCPGGQHGEIAPILGLVGTGPRAHWEGGGWATPVTPFVRQTVVYATDAADDDATSTRRTESEGRNPANDIMPLPNGLSELLPEVVGLRVEFDWFEYAQRALRDDILVALTEDDEIRTALRIDRDAHGGPEALPFRIRAGGRRAPSAKRRRTSA